MNQEDAEELLALAQVGPRLEELLRQTGEPARRAQLLAQLLHQFRPSSPLAVCSLPAEGEPCLAAVDGTGEPRPRWADLLRRETLTDGRLPAALALSGWTLALESFPVVGGRGALGLAVPENAAAAQGAGRALLTVVGQQLLLRLALQVQQQQLLALQKEVATETSLATVGELARPVTHEFNNFLNVLLLHMAVLDMELPPNLRQEVAEIQKQGKSITAVVRQFQRYRQQQGGAGAAVDLSAAGREAVAALAGGEPVAEGDTAKIHPAHGGEAVAVRLQLAPDLPRLSGVAADFRRLCQFLLSNAAAVLDPARGSITLKTHAAPGKVVLRVEDNGPPVPAEQLNHLFDLNTTVREGTCALEMAACKSLARRLQGAIQAENLPEGGLAVSVEFTQASR